MVCHPFMKNNSLLKIRNQIFNNLPVIISILILILSFSYTLNQVANDTNNLHQSTINSSNNFSLELKEQIKANIDVVSELLAKQWINTNNESRLYDQERFFQLVPSFFNYSSSFLAINWINTSGIITWVYPYERNAEAINKSILFYPNTNELNDAFALAQNSHVVGFSRLTKFLQGGEGFVAYIPVIYNQNTIGYFNLVFEIDSIINYVSTHVPANFFSFKIFEGSTLVGSIGENFTLNGSFVQNKDINIYNKVLYIYTSPNSELIENVSLFSQSTIFITEILLCVAIYYLTDQLKKKNILIKKEFSEKEKMLEVMYNNKKLEALGTLSGGIAHDFNNILTNIIGHLQIIESDIIPHLKENNIDKDILSLLDSSLLSISRNVQRSKEITGQILAFSKQGPIDFHIINLYEIIRESIKLVQETNDRRVTFDIISPKEEHYVYGNQSRLIQIFMNILINSINAMTGNDPKIQISCSVIENLSSSVKKNGRVEYLNEACVIKIRDNGKGMSEEQIKNAFDPFYTHKSSGKGTGLGLGIVYNNVIAMHGEVSIKSELEKFTEIEIKFPLIKKPSTIVETKIKKEERKDDYNNLQSKTMLIIDDEIDIINSYSKIFEKYGLKVIGHTLGTQAWDYYKENFKNIDIVLTDINLPDINGFDLINLIKSIRWNQKVILMTGFTEVNAEDIDLPIVQKPFNIPKLLKLLSSLFE